MIRLPPASAQLAVLFMFVYLVCGVYVWAGWCKGDLCVSCVGLFSLGAVRAVFGGYSAVVFY